MSSLDKLMGVSRREIIMSDEIRKRLGAASKVEEIYNHEMEQSLPLDCED
jgi:hypothetical protein